MTFKIRNASQDSTPAYLLCLGHLDHIIYPIRLFIDYLVDRRDPTALLIKHASRLVRGFGDSMGLGGKIRNRSSVL